MASLADLFAGAAQAAGGYQYDPNLTPEANAMAGAKPPAAMPSFERPKGLTNTIGRIADALAIMGGEQPRYESSLRQREADFNVQQKQNILGEYLANPSDPELQKRAFKVAPLETFEIVTKLTPPARNPGSRSPFQVAYDDAIAAGATPQQAQQEGIRVAQAIAQSRPIPTANGYQMPGDAIGVDPYRAPPAPPPPSYAPQVLANGNIGSFDQRTGRVVDTGVPAAPKGAAAKPAAAGAATDQLAVLDMGLARLNNAIKELEKGGVSGPVTGLLPDAALNFTNPRAVAVAEDVASVSQQQLRAILGGQFARAEGEQLIKRQYNPGQSEAENLRRLKLLRTQIETRRKQLAGGGTAAPAPAASGGFKVVGKRKP